jgi:hypothetical protein
MRIHFSQGLPVAFVLLCFFVAVVDAEGQTKLADSPLQLHAGIPIVVDPSEDSAVLAAVADLRRDLRKVFGSDSPVISNEQADLNSPAIVVACTGLSTKNFRDRTPLPPEAYSISLARNNPNRIVLEGGDIRGTIYSIYEFSDRALGVPPLWFWSGWQPTPQRQITVSPAVFRRINEPSVRWRAWFPNDTDMLFPWLSASDDHIELFLETLLRLRFNVLDVDHISNWENHPNMGLVLARRCKARGIKVTFTHLAPFGFLLGDWDKYWSTVRHEPSPPRLLSNLTALDEFWTYAIHFVEDEHLDVIQSIEFRVDGDKPFWRSFPEAPPDEKARAQIISSMLNHQMRLLRKVSRGPVPLTRTVFYNEVGEFLDDGVLTPPTDPLLLWNYSSEQRDHYPRPEIFHPHSPQQEFGYYLNLQFFTTGSHLTAGEGPWKVGQNLRQVTTGVKPGHLRFVVLNVGNVREFTMEIAVASALLWDSTMTVDAALDAFCERYFDSTSAKAVRDLYHSYYYAYWQQKKPNLKNFDRQYIFHDLRYARAAENLLARLETGHYSAAPLFQDPHMLKIDPADSQASDEPHAIINGTTMSIERLQKVVAASRQLAPRMPDANRALFDETLQSDASFMLAANLFLRDVAHAYIEVNDAKSANQYLASAAMHLEEMRNLVAARQRPYLTGWYEHETKFNLDGMVHRLEHTRLTLSQTAMSCALSTQCDSRDTSSSPVVVGSR